MAPRLTLALLGCLSLLLTGCIGTKPERVHVRRTPEQIARDDAGPKGYAELREQLKQEEEARALDGRLSRSEAHLKVTRLRLAAAMESRGDPWENYENERRFTLYKHWSDRFSPPPIIEGEPLPGEAPPPSEDEEEEPADEYGEDEGGGGGGEDADDYGY